MKLILALLALIAAAYIREDFWDACLAIATAAHWQKVTWVSLGLLGGCVCTVGVFVALGAVWGIADMRRADRRGRI